MSHKKPKQPKHDPIRDAIISAGVAKGIAKRSLNLVQNRGKAVEDLLPLIDEPEPLPPPPPKKLARAGSGRGGRVSFLDVMRDPALTKRPDDTPHPPGNPREEDPPAPRTADDDWMLDLYHGGRRRQAR